MPKAIQESGAFNSTGGRYHPPEYFDSGAYKKMSVHSFNSGGKHPLADRARKLKTEGILIIRFEMPFNIWCDHCGDLITMGIRFNAEKKCIGSFHSTPVYSFAMKCLFCGGQIVIETDPENRTYAIRKGAHKQVKEYDASDDPNAIPLDTMEEVQKRRSNPMAKAQTQEEDQAKGNAAIAHLEELKKLKDKTSRNDYDTHRSLKQKFRATHGLYNDRKRQEEEAIKKRPLPPETEEDRSRAKRVAFRNLPASLAERVAQGKKADQWNLLLT